MNLLHEIWNIYEYSFPENERRDLESHKQIMNNPLYHLVPLKNQDRIIGFIAYWDLDDFVFIEHLAIKRGLRGKGYGSKTINKMTSLFPKIILEVEEPETEEARKRIRFYQKHGFYLNSYPYLQPPYKPQDAPVPLLLMSFPSKMDELEFCKAREIMYTKVYQMSNVKSSTH